MCGRARQSLSPQAYAQVSGIPEDRWRDRHAYNPSFNLAPGMWLPVIRCNSETREPEIQTMKWGLVPSFHKKEEKLDFFKMFNARSETVGTSPVFKRLLPSKRCIVLINGFYEWEKKDPKKKQPYYIHRNSLMALAGLYDVYTGHDGETLYTFTICTTDSSSRLQWLHDRMPVILPDRAEMEAWLGAPLPATSLFQEDGTVSEDALEACTKGNHAPSTSPAKPDLSSGGGSHGQQTPVKAEAPGLDRPDGEKGEGHSPQGGSKPKPERKEDKDAQQQEVAALVSKVCKPYAGEDLQWHPVTTDVGKTSFQSPKCVEDIRKSKGSIASFFKPKQSPSANQQQATKPDPDGKGSVESAEGKRKREGGEEQVKQDAGEAKRHAQS